MVRLWLGQCPQDDCEAEEDAGGPGGHTEGRVDQHVSHTVPGPVIGLGGDTQQPGEQLIHVNKLDRWVDLPLAVSVEIWNFLC